ncbi:MAG: redoxin domain-containing protein, partial [Acidimicrobiia bacterium]|nr:redoxin domain-containing protein [Acidimicrobiia bacterium]
MESKHFRDLAAEFAALGATIVGVSADRSDRQKQFDEANQ